MVLNIAHRGARSLAPENTILAAQKALQIGADLWETDLAVTKDAHLCLFHDTLLTRTTDVKNCFPDRATEPFSHFTLKQIRRLSPGVQFVQSDPFGQITLGEVTADEKQACLGAKIPTLEEALIFTREAHWRINLELKRLPPNMSSFPVVNRVLNTLKRVGMPAEQIVLSSFYHPWLREIQTRRPDLTVQALLGLVPDQPLDWGRQEFNTYNVRGNLITPGEIGAMRRQGIRINIFTVNAVAEMEAFMAAGVAGLFTDFPQRLARLKTCPKSMRLSEKL